jgi:hypothetical protein
VLHVQRDDNLAVGTSLEGVDIVEVLANEAVVVNLAIDGKDDRVVLVGQGLSTRLYGRLIPVYVAVSGA